MLAVVLDDVACSLPDVTGRGRSPLGPLAVDSFIRPPSPLLHTPADFHDRTLETGTICLEVSAEKYSVEIYNSNTNVFYYNI